MKKILEKEEPVISKKLEIGDPSLWMYTTTTRGQPALMYRVLFHYDILINKFYREKHLESYEKDESLNILDKSREITFVTFWAKPETLIKRIKQRNKNIIPELIKDYFRTLPLHYNNFMTNRRVLRFYTNPKELDLIYKKWFEFCDKYKAKAYWIIDTTTDSPNLIPLSDWLENSLLETS